MSKDPLSTYAAEFNSLLDALPAAVKRASEILQQSGIDAAGYLDADNEVTRIVARITELVNDYLRAPSAGVLAPLTPLVEAEQSVNPVSAEPK